jgi:hypothetical protein
MKRQLYVLWNILNFFFMAISGYSLLAFPLHFCNIYPSFPSASSSLCAADSSLLQCTSLSAA